MVCVSFSPLSNYLLVGLASRTVIVSTGSEEVFFSVLYIALCDGFLMQILHSYSYCCSNARMAVVHILIHQNSCLEFLLGIRVSAV